MSTHPLAIVSLSSSMLAYASAFVGSPALIWPGLAVAAVAVVTGVLARRAIRAEAGRAEVSGSGGLALATAGALSGAAFVVLGTTLVLLARGTGSA